MEGGASKGEDVGAGGPTEIIDQLDISRGVLNYAPLGGPKAYRLKE